MYTSQGGYSPERWRPIREGLGLFFHEGLGVFFVENVRSARYVFRMSKWGSFYQPSLNGKLKRFFFK